MLSLSKFKYALGALLFSAVVQPAYAEDVTIRFSNWLPSSYWLSDWYIKYTKEVERVTEGRVKVEVLPKVVGTPQTQYEVVTEGLADMAFLIPGYTPGRYRLAEMGELPLTGDDMNIAAPAFNDIYMKHFLKFNEFKEVKLLAVFNNNAAHIVTTKKQIKTLDDLKGLKIRSANGTVSKLLQAAGAVPVQKNVSEAYELLSTGALDGSVQAYDVVLSMNAVDIMKYFNQVPGSFANSLHALIINTDVWNKISGEDQRLIESVSGAAVAKLIAEGYTQQDKKAIQAMKEANYVIEPLSQEAVDEFKKLSESVVNDWIEDAKGMGVEDPGKILEELRSLANK